MFILRSFYLSSVFFFIYFFFFLHLFAAIFILNLIYFSYISNIHSVLKVKKSFVGYAEILILTPFSLGRSINFYYNEYRFDAFLTFFFLVSGFDSFVFSLSMSLSLPLCLSVSLSLSLYLPLSISILSSSPFAPSLLPFYSKTLASLHIYSCFFPPLSPISTTHTHVRTLTQKFSPHFLKSPKTL